MSRLQVLAIAAMLAVGVFAWELIDRNPAPAPADPPAAQASRPAPPAAPAPAPVAARGPADVGRAPNFLRPPSVSTTTASQLAREFGEATNYKAVYDRLNGTAEGQTPEGQFFLYKILRACATVADRKFGQPRPQNPAQVEERRQQVAASLPEGDPRRAQRLEAFDKVNADRCAGITGVVVSEAELAQYLKNALAGGDPKARAWQVEQDMWQERRAASTPGRPGTTLTDAQVASLKEAFASRDPEAIVIAGRVLANSFRDMTVRIGPGQEAIENRTFMNAALLLACEYGYACGENNDRVLNACAYQGHCGVAGLADYLFYYGASPYDAQLLDRYRSVLRQAAETGDWSGIVLDRGNRTAAPPSYSPAALSAGR